MARKTNEIVRHSARSSAPAVKEVFAAFRRDVGPAGGFTHAYTDEHTRDLPSRINFLWKATRLTAEELAEAFGCSVSALKSWAAGRASPSLEHLIRIQEVTEISIQWLATGQWPMLVNTGASLPAPLEPGYIYIPRFDVRVGAGTGQVVETENLKGFLAFREDWVRTRLRRNPAHLVVFEAYGDSMFPTIADGDIMLVDTSEERVRGTAIYVVLAGNEAIVKRVELKIDGSLLVKSDNPTYEPMTLKGDQVAELRVLGKVVWAGGLV